MGSPFQFRRGSRSLARAAIHHWRRWRTYSWFKRRLPSAQLVAPQQPDRKSLRNLICISRVEHLGDIVACEPVARHIRAEEPDATIVWCVSNAYRSLVEHNPNVDVVLPVSGVYEWSLWAASGTFGRVIDLNLDKHPDGWHGWAYRRTDADTGVTAWNYAKHGPLLHAFTKGAGLPILSDPPRVYIPDNVKTTVDRFGLPAEFVAVHCISNGPAKDWTAAKWRELADMIWRRFRLPMVELGLKSAFDALRPSVTSLCGKSSILESAEVIRRAKLFIGVDSGPAHLANAVGTPGVVLLGDWVPYVDASWARLVQAREGRVSEIEMDRVYEAVEDRLSSVVAVC